MNNDYAKNWRESHLGPGGEIAFYTDGAGIVGSSFDSEEVNRLLSISFSPPDEPAMDDGSFQRAIILEEKYYIVRAIPFRDIEGNDIGSALLFIPFQPIAAATVVAIFATCIFLVLSTLLRGAKQIRSKHGRHEMYYVTTLALTLFFLTFFTLYFAIIRLSLELEEPSYALYNSTITMDPESGVFKINDEQTVAIALLTGGEAVNAVKVVVNYDPSKVKVEDILTGNSLCGDGFIIEKTNDEASGRVTVACAVPNPGFTEGRGTVAELVVRPLSEGEFALSFEEETQVLANDGLGTNVLRSKTGGNYQVSGARLSEQAGSVLDVYSFTHPNSERWYNKKNVSAFWLAQPGYAYAYAFNAIPDFVPSGEPMVTDSHANFLAKEDGLFYVHVLETRDGLQTRIAHHAVRIDTTPPPPPVIKASQTDIAPGDVVLFDFENTDTKESMQSGFYVRLNGTLFFPVKPPLYAPFFAAGDYPVTARIFDKAGNTSENTIVIHVRK